MDLLKQLHESNPRFSSQTVGIQNASLSDLYEECDLGIRDFITLKDPSRIIKLHQECLNEILGNKVHKDTEKCEIEKIRTFIELLKTGRVDLIMRSVPSWRAYPNRAQTWNFGCAKAPGLEIPASGSYVLKYGPTCGNSTAGAFARPKFQV